jgi:hypothetical protein
MSSTGGLWQTTPLFGDLHSSTYPAGGFFLASMGNYAGPLPVAPTAAPEPESSLFMACGTLGIVALQARKHRRRPN